MQKGHKRARSEHKARCIPREMRGTREEKQEEEEEEEEKGTETLSRLVADTM